MLTKEEIINKYGKPDPNRKNNFIYYDAIDSLPDNLELSIKVFTFDPKKLDEYFTNVGTKEKPSWYPCTDLMYKIADMCGIIGCDKKTVEWIMEEVDINTILCKPFGSEPTMRIIKTGARVTKQSKVLCEDGNFRLSSPESNEFNFFNRAEIEFLNEEKYTNNYTKKQDYYKFDTPVKRQLRLKELEKFAVQQAETKAFCKTIRVLAGLPTGFSTKDLQEGKLIFSKYIKSKRLQKFETAARIYAIRHGHTGELQDMSGQLFGNEQIEAPVEPVNETITDDKHPENEIKTSPFSDFKPEPDEKTKIKNQIEKYYISYETVIEKVDNARDAIANYIINYEKISVKKLKEMLWKIENNISGIKKMKHDIDLSEFGPDVF